MLRPMSAQFFRIEASVPLTSNNVNLHTTILVATLCNLGLVSVTEDRKLGADYSLTAPTDPKTSALR
jgi:hypothetical protein